MHQKKNSKKITHSTLNQNFYEFAKFEMKTAKKFVRVEIRRLINPSKQYLSMIFIRRIYKKNFSNLSFLELKLRLKKKIGNIRGISE